MSSLAEDEQRGETAYVLHDVGKAVDNKVRWLQNHYLNEDSRDHAKARAWLAKLRRGVNKDPGAVPELWPMILEGIPLLPMVGDDTSPQEYSAHTALTLYAVHQQSRTEPMHQPRHFLGAAVQRLTLEAPSKDAVMRRFQALCTATEIAEIMHHARGLIRQLRQHRLGLDYGRFADELVWLQDSELAGKVRRRWGRDFHRAGSWRVEAMPERTDHGQ